MELAGKHVVITGAGSGIGRACAARFAAEGARVVASDRDGESVRTVAEAIGALAVTADVSRESEIIGLIAAAQAEHGPIDLFFSNAGVPGPGGGPEAPDDELQQTWEVNVMAHVWAARALLPDWVARGDGYLLSTASAAGVLTQVGAMVYSVTKHAAVATAEWLSITYRDRGIKVSCLCPLGVRTPMLDLALEDTVGAAALMRDELLEPEDVAEAVVAGIREERFLILPHPQVAKYMSYKGQDNERWLAGMRRMVGAARQSGARG